MNEETTNDGAITALKNLSVKPKNQINARHMLASAQQNVSESIDEFVLGINQLNQECDFVAVNAQHYQGDMKRDSFIGLISSNFIRQRLHESRTQTTTKVYEKARSLELAKIDSESYSSQDMKQGSVCIVRHESHSPLSGSDAGPRTADDQAVTSIPHRNATQNFLR